MGNLSDCETGKIEKEKVWGREELFSLKCVGEKLTNGGLAGRKRKKDKRAKERLVEKKMNREREGVLNRSYCGEH